MMEAKEMIKTFCERLGIQSEANAEGIYAFEVDSFEFAIHDLSEQHRIALVGDLGMIPEAHPEGLFRLMLEAQHGFRETKGATFSIDRERERLSLCQVLSCAELDNDVFFKEVEHFVNQLEAWTQIIRDYEGKKESVEISSDALDLYQMMV